MGDRIENKTGEVLTVAEAIGIQAVLPQFGAVIVSGERGSADYRNRASRFGKRQEFVCQKQLPPPNLEGTNKLTPLQVLCTSLCERVFSNEQEQALAVPECHNGPAGVSVFSPNPD